MRTQGVFSRWMGTALAVVPLVALMPAAASAQGTVVFRGRGNAPPPAGDVLFATPVPAGRVGVIAVEPLETGRPVKGAPYSADAVTETTQVLADGNRIEHRSSSSIARDSRGRVRREHQAVPLGGFVAPVAPVLTTIVDPSTGLHITLDHERKVAHVVSATGSFGFSAAAAPGIPVDPAFVAGGQAGRPLQAGTFQLGMGPANTTQANTVSTTIETTKLGERTLDGVRAEGTRTTIVIPAGAAGNQLPIEIVSERWYSPELQVVLQTERSDPRFGDTTYRLTNIMRAEPPSDLFEVPPDFQIQK